MRLMMIHAESFSYEAKVKTPIAVELSEEEMSGDFDESLIVMYSTEKEDEEDPVEVSKLAAREIGSYLSKIGQKPIILFPFAFLISREEKSSSRTAARMENLLMEALGRSDLAVVPFGWYKKFAITSMGHKYTVHSARVILPGKEA